jgi:16S rRNA (cytosine1402-N4)-methyltransferase
VERLIGRRERIHPATRVFQALRIEVNKELDNLQRILGTADKHMRSGGRLAVISFHSLEDRIVKHALRGNPAWRVLTKKPLRATRGETLANPRSRSAKLRAAERA